MLQQFTGRYLQQSSTGGLSVQTATLTDADLIRGDDTGESVAAANGFRLFDGLQRVDFAQQQIVTVSDGEAVTTVTFNDGATIFGVLALYDEQFGPYASVTRQFLLDPSALEAVGMTLEDVASVRVDGLFDHDLGWADFGFTPAGAPEPAPVLTLLQGTNGNDRLTGTAADELIRGGDGDDRLTGRAGEDTFVFGAEARDGNRDRDVIADFDATEDTILFEAGATIRLVEERNGNLVIQLEGDRDTIIVQNADSAVVGDFVFDDDPFTV